mmetsp:Transcript_8373/g.14472  ORF Transcript_8373/g.14472 Transcript_8373/m.14472 type:complete len:736 (+) Transcript_8373:28-2235(+)
MSSTSAPAATSSKKKERFQVDLVYDEKTVKLTHFDRSQDLTSLFEKHFPELISKQFTIVFKKDGKTLKKPTPEDIEDGVVLTVKISSSSQSNDNDVSEDDDNHSIFYDAYDQMSNPKTGVEVKDRKWLMKTYSQCFTGKDATQWFIKNKFATDVTSAVEFGKKMGELFLFEHVTRDHEFKNEGLYYHFKNLQDNKSWSKVLDGNDNDNDVGRHQPTLQKPTEDMMAALKSIDVLPLDEHNIKLLDNVHPPNHVDPTPQKTYNMVVIGAGAGGLVTAVGSVGMGAKVALIERHLLGGDCLNVGCVPSKCLLRCAKAVKDAKNGGEFGVRVKGEVEVDFGAIMERMRRIRASIAPVDSVKRVSSLGVDVFIGEAKFGSKNTVIVNGQTLKFAKACIATGGRAALPPIKGLDKVSYLTNASLFNLTEQPKRMGIIGAGAIGCEMAQAFARFGTKVYLFARSDHIMTREDPDGALIIEQSLLDDGVILKTGFTYEEIQQKSDGDKAISIIGKLNGLTEKIEVDQLLVSTGRVPNVEGLNLEGAGVKYNKRDGVLVSDTLQTSNSNVYAAGDICSVFKFTHMADAHARIVIKNALFFGSAKASALTLPWCTYTEPELAHVGLYESDMEEKGIKYTTFRRDFDDVDRAITDGQTEGFVKVHVEKGTDKIIGATIVGEHAGDMISELTLAMVGGVGLGTIANVIHPYPTQADAIRHAAGAFNRTRLTPAVRILFRKLLAARR